MVELHSRLTAMAFDPANSASKTPTTHEQADLPIFMQAKVIEYLRALVNAESLILYCGAGVTRDKTELGWSELIRALHESIQAEDQLRLEAFLPHESYNNLSPEQYASALVYNLEEASDDSDEFDENTAIARHLKKVLYQQHGWGAGRLLTNLATLAVTTASRGKSIEIITTNYDTYLVDEIFNVLEHLQSNQELADQVEPSDLPSDLPTLTIRYFETSDPPITRPLFPASTDHPQSSAGSIVVTHLHGCVFDDNSPAFSLFREHQKTHIGEIVLSEGSYATTATITREYLVDALKKDNTSFVTFGASLTDPPLINALAEAKASDKSGFRLAVLTPEGSTTEEKRALNRAREMRGHHLGLQVLIVDHIAQVAQFAEELGTCISLRELGGESLLDTYNLTTSSQSTISYPSRLKAWWAQVKEPFSNPYYDFLAFISLKNARDQIEKIFQNYFAESESRGDVGEVLKVELWIRVDPGTANRKLTLMANSVGPILDQSALRTEDIQPYSNVASVSAFTNGRSRIINLESLQHNAHSCRWKSFFCVPVWHETSPSWDQSSVTTRVPVGVITLCSTEPSTDGNSKGGSEAFFAREEFTSAQKEELIRLLRNCAIYLTNPEAIEKGLQSLRKRSAKVT